MTAFVTGITGAGSFRLALALLVFVHHTTRVSLGMTAVYVFFELSGFWICTMWNGRYAKASFPYGVYLVSRAWRLMPVFILSAIVAWSVVYFQGVPVPNFNWVHRAISNIFILGYSGDSWPCSARLKQFISTRKHVRINVVGPAPPRCCAPRCSRARRQRSLEPCAHEIGPKADLRGRASMARNHGAVAGLLRRGRGRGSGAKKIVTAPPETPSEFILWHGLK